MWASGLPSTEAVEQAQRLPVSGIILFETPKQDFHELWGTRGTFLYNRIQHSRFGKVFSYLFVWVHFLIATVQFRNIWTHSKQIELTITAVAGLCIGVAYFREQSTKAWLAATIGGVSNSIIYGGRELCGLETVLRSNKMARLGQGLALAFFGGGAGVAGMKYA